MTWRTVSVQQMITVDDDDDDDDDDDAAAEYVASLDGRGLCAAWGV